MYISGLVKFGNIDGLFLVRESSYSSSSFVLSLVSKGIFYHFQINEIKSSHFSIDDGPVVHGKISQAESSRLCMVNYSLILPCFKERQSLRIPVYFPGQQNFPERGLLLKNRICS